MLMKAEMTRQGLLVITAARAKDKKILKLDTFAFDAFFGDMVLQRDLEKEDFIKDNIPTELHESLHLGSPVQFEMDISPYLFD